MSGLSKELVELKLPIKSGKKSIEQMPRQFALEVMFKIKEEIKRLLKKQVQKNDRVCRMDCRYRSSN